MLELDGKTYDALIKEVDYNAIANTVEEVDFQALVSNEKVHSVAEIILENQEKVELVFCRMVERSCIQSTSGRSG